MSKSVLSQEEMQAQFLPLLKEQGVLYRKTKQVRARPAKPGEKVTSVTSDGVETQNTAKEGDFVIQNQTEAKELYIISGEKFKERYVFKKDTTSEYKIYKAQGKVYALEISPELLERFELDNPFYFIAPWQEESIARKLDLLVCPPDYSEIYRIARKEFFETYQKE